MPGCAVYGCKSYSRKTKGTDIRYYEFPKQGDICAKWIAACRRKDKFNTKNAYVCSLHFNETSFQTNLKHELLNYTPKNNRNLKEDANPYLSLIISKRLRKRKIQDEVTNILSCKRSTIDFQEHQDNNAFDNVSNLGNQTFLSLKEDEITSLKSQLLEMELKIADLQKQNQLLMTERNEAIAKLKDMENTIPEKIT
ncbi:hypothetical protein ABEB36_015180 [Hypothenemus hampei]|uniref:THAP-type domain-containing protein n=1 Tax=Hypothenemus hampei TaxID=57062 RepID=A0ABD1E0X8_HYPHA